MLPAAWAAGRVRAEGRGGYPPGVGGAVLVAMGVFVGVGVGVGV
jgi:hypothetical protein